MQQNKENRVADGAKLLLMDFLDMPQNMQKY